MPGYSVYSDIQAKDKPLAGALKTFATGVQDTDEINDTFIEAEATRQKAGTTDTAAKKRIDDQANDLKAQLNQYYTLHPTPQMQLDSLKKRADDLTTSIDDLKKARKKEKDKTFDPLEFAAIHISNWFIKGLLTFIQLGLLMGSMIKHSNEVRKKVNEIDKLIAEAEKTLTGLEAQVQAAAAQIQPATPNEDQGIELAAPGAADLLATASPRPGATDSDDEDEDQTNILRPGSSSSSS
jgi:prefoldin subunit 5